MPKPRYNQNITVTINSLGFNGEGVGHWHGYTIFADGALPHEVIRGRLAERQRRHGRVATFDVVEKSPHRVPAPCPLFDRCGGCQLMHLSYPQQLVMKRQRIVDALERNTGITDAIVHDCVPSPSSSAYRNKIQLPAVPGPDGIQIGLYARDSHNLVDVDACLIHCPIGEQAYQACRKIICNSTILTAYDFDSETGDLRFLLIRTAVNTGQALVVLITHGPGPTEELKRIADEIMIACPAVKGVVQNINTNADNVVLGDQYHLLAGQAHIEEDLLSLRFKVSPASFFQVNTAQAENLYRKTMELAALAGKESVLDAYCGVGTLSLISSTHAKSVTGVECVPEAIADAKVNADVNNIDNCTFVCADVATYIETCTAVDVAILNPPRKGCDAAVLQGIAKIMPQTVVYISCDPSTLTKDLAHLITAGYHLESLHPFDMFPHTAHVECIAKLSVHKK